MFNSKSAVSQISKPVTNTSLDVPGQVLNLDDIGEADNCKSVLSQLQSSVKGLHPAKLRKMFSHNFSSKKEAEGNTYSSFVSQRGNDADYQLNFAPTPTPRTLLSKTEISASNRHHSADTVGQFDGSIENVESSGHHCETIAQLDGMDDGDMDQSKTENEDFDDDLNVDGVANSQDSKEVSADIVSEDTTSVGINEEIGSAEDTLPLSVISVFRYSTNYS